MVLKELQQALRNLHRARRFSLACIITLTVALAGTVTLINLLEAFVFRRLAVADATNVATALGALGLDARQTALIADATRLDPSLTGLIPQGSLQAALGTALSWIELQQQSGSADRPRVGTPVRGERS